MSLANDIVQRARQGEPRTAAGYDPRQYISPWTPEADEEVVRLRDSGLAYKEVALIMGMSVAAVVGRYMRLTKDRRS